MTVSWTRRLVGGAAAVIAATSIAACAGDPAPSTEPTSAPTAPATTTAAPPPAGPTITDQQAQTLCSDLEQQLSDWRLQGPTLGRGGLNILVQNWAAASGSINIAVLQDRSIVDTVTIDTCPDVRTQAVELLDIPDLASGLVGL